MLVFTDWIMNRTNPFPPTLKSKNTRPTARETRLNLKQQYYLYSHFFNIIQALSYNIYLTVIKSKICYLLTKGKVLKSQSMYRCLPIQDKMLLKSYSNKPWLH